MIHHDPSSSRHVVVFRRRRSLTTTTTTTTLYLYTVLDLFFESRLCFSIMRRTSS
jgi:hypothetical protein